jgi:hypothetical protein
MVATRLPKLGRNVRDVSIDAQLSHHRVVACHQAVSHWSGHLGRRTRLPGVGRDQGRRRHSGYNYSLPVALTVAKNGDHPRAAVRKGDRYPPDRPVVAQHRLELVGRSRRATFLNVEGITGWSPPHRFSRQNHSGLAKWVASHRRPPMRPRRRHRFEASRSQKPRLFVQSPASSLRAAPVIAVASPAAVSEPPTPTAIAPWSRYSRALSTPTPPVGTAARSG